jgi:hypothetical protein
LEQAIDEFSDSAKGAEVALFYFAGMASRLPSGAARRTC